MIQPITPQQVGQTKGALFPPKVVQAFNELIASHYVGNRSSFTQDDVISRITSLTLTDPDITNPETAVANLRKAIFKRGWLNVEAYYEDAGWKVEYDKPAYDETYPARFTFTRADCG